MKMNRRQFLLLIAMAVAGCRAVKNGGASTTPRERMVDAGPVGDYATDGVYGRFRDQDFFVIRKGGALFAVSAICTHRKCKLSAETDHSFFCPCHGSTFGPDGKVTRGPARRDLPVLTAFTNEKGQLLVKVPDR